MELAQHKIHEATKNNRKSQFIDKKKIEYEKMFVKKCALHDLHIFDRQNSKR